MDARPTNKKNMNKILLTIIGVVGLTAASWGQVPPSLTVQGLGELTGNSPLQLQSGSITLGIAPYDNSHSIYTTSYGGPIPVGTKLHFYTSDDGKRFLQVFEKLDGSYSLVAATYQTAPSWMGGVSHELWVDGNGNPISSDGLSSSGLGLSINPSNFLITYDGGGFGPGYSLGGDDPDGGGASGAVIAQQASDLNIGLEFNDGQWTIAQPQ